MSCRRASPLAAAFLAASLWPAAALAQSLPVVANAETARIIVRFKADAILLKARAGSAAGASAVRAAALGQRLGLRIWSGATVSELAQVVLATGVTSRELAERLAQESDVEYAVADERRLLMGVPDDPLFAAGVAGNGPEVGQWYLRAPSGEVRSSLDAEPAWAVTTGSPEVIVAVVDTGVRFDHPDLLSVAAGGKLLPGYDMVSDPAMANDGDGRDADASDPGDWVTGQELSAPGGTLFRCMRAPEESSWHGTQVAGLIAALTDNGIGMAGTAPGVRVLPVRVLGKCGGYDSDIVAGVRWAAGLPVPGVPANPHPARIVNLSLGGEGSCSPAYQEAIDEVTAAGVVVVASAGNSSGHAVAMPANCSGVIAVAGLRHSGTKVGYSSLGPEVAISAPAGNCVNTAAGSPCLYPILTTMDAGSTVPAGPTYSDSYRYSVGTSFSAPLVAGVAALALSARPDLSPQTLKQLLQGTARPFPPAASGASVPECTLPQYDLRGQPVDQQECHCTISTCGAGMLDAAGVLTTLRPSGSVTAPPAGHRERPDAPAPDLRRPSTSTGP